MKFEKGQLSTDAQIIANALQAIAEEMGYIIQKASSSVTITVSQDLSCSIFDAKLRQLAQPGHVPIHLGEFPAGVKTTMDYIGLENLRPGDMTITNDPFLGNVPHLPDLHIHCPVFYKGDLVFITCNTTHNVDIGGSAPGSFAWGSFDIFGDGIRIPPLKLYREGKVVTEIFDILLANIRAPEDQKKDFMAQVAANEYGRNELIKLLDRYGKEHVEACMEEFLSYTERRMRAEIRAMPDGTYYGEDFVEGDGITDEIVNFKVAITIKGDEMHLDWTGSHPQMPGPVNLVSCRTIGAAYVGLSLFADPDMPHNYGRLAPVSFTLPPHTVVNTDFPHATSCTHESVGKAVVAVSMALGQAMPERAFGAEGQSNMDMGMTGVDARHKRRFAHMHFGPHGYGARATKDGLDTKSDTHGGRIANAPAEILESRSSLRLRRFALIQDSGGPGKFRGGQGGLIEIEYLGDEPCPLIIGGDKIKIPPEGVYDGWPGSTGTYRLIRGNGKEEIPTRKTKHFLNKGDIIKDFHPGGGGYGDPLERDPERVKEDLLEGYISQKAANDDYGVVVNLKTETIDYEATGRLRSELRKKSRDGRDRFIGGLPSHKIGVR
jgi:N-methylhydantoinase B